MPLILVAEEDARYSPGIREALTAEGWRVQVAHREQDALAAAREETPDVAVVTAGLPGASTLFSQLCRKGGGPGVVALLNQSSGPGHDAARRSADELIAEPFALPEILSAIRRQAAPEAPGGLGPGDTGPLTSADIFGDMLAEVAGEMASPAPPPPTASAPKVTPPASGSSVRPPAPAASSPRSAAPAARPRRMDAVERKLEETLSGILEETSAPRPKTPSRKRPGPELDVDALLSETLSGLDLKRRARSRPEDEDSPGTGVSLPQPPAPEPATPASASATPQTAAPREPAPAPPAPAPPAPIVTPSPVASPPTPVSPLAPPPSAASVEPPRPMQPTELPAFSESIFRQPEELTGALGGVEMPPPLAEPEEQPALVLPEEVEAPEAPSLPTSVAAPTTPAREPEKKEVLVGEGEVRQFGQYTLLERIAVGGMAEVWKARMSGVEGFQKMVAIKKILPHLTTNTDFVHMFVDEAKLAAQLNHPHIVHIYDLGKLGERYFIAMEYVEGTNLRDLLNEAHLKQVPLPLGLSLLVAARLASALDYAHRRRDFEGREMGLVHRDVSPQNVLISFEGDIKLCDFGIVKAVSKASHTQMGALKGKLQYMSPEQAWGKSVDSRSDIFSLGSILFEMLTGRRLFAGDSEINVLEAVRQCRVQSPRKVNPDIPYPVEEITLKALEQNPDHRYQSADEMLQELEKVLRSFKIAPGQTDLAAYLRHLREAPEQPEPPAEPHRSWGSSSGLLNEGSALREASATDLGGHHAEAREPTATGAGTGAGVRLGVASPPATGTKTGVGDSTDTSPGSAAAARSDASRPLEPVGRGAAHEEEEGKRGRWLLIALIVLLLLVAGASFLFRRQIQGWLGIGASPPPIEEPAGPAAPGMDTDAGEASPQEGAEGAPSESEPAAEPAAQGETTVVPNMEEMVDQAMAERERELRRQLDAERRRLQKELDEVQAQDQGPKPRKKSGGGSSAPSQSSDRSVP